MTEKETELVMGTEAKPGAFLVLSAGERPAAGLMIENAAALSPTSLC